MKFIDNAVIFVKGGKGGDGAVCFRVEKNNYNVKIPFGGDGGNGGSVYFKINSNLNSLINFSFKRYYEAKNGENGKSKNAKGMNADDVIVCAPYGTQIFDYKTKEFIGSLFSKDDFILVSKGGIGGIGNFKLHKLKKSDDYLKGGYGEFKILKLELKILADVVFFGLPNSGKSTLIVKISLSKSKISDYPFTTIYPKLGVVFFKNNSFTIADTPGILYNASCGVGLGFNFLKHFLKSKLLFYVIDISFKDRLSLLYDMHVLRMELLQYSEKFSNENFWIILNKSDLVLRYKLLYIYKYIYHYYNVPIFIISSLKGYGMKKLCNDISFYLFNY